MVHSSELIVHRVIILNPKLNYLPPYSPRHNLCKKACR